MGKDLHTIDQIFLSALEPYEEVPSEKVWNSIENTLLDKRSAAEYKKKFHFLRAIAALLVLILLTVGINEIHHLKKPYSQFTRKNTRPNFPSTLLRSLPQGNNKKANHSSLSLHYSPNAPVNKLGNERSVAPPPGKKIVAQTNYPSFPVINENYKSSKNTGILPRTITEPLAVPIARLGKIDAYKGNLSKFLEPCRRCLEEKNSIAETHLSSANSFIFPKTKHITPLPGIYITVMFSPDISSYRLKNNDSSNNQSSGEFKSKETEGLSYTAGIILGYDINKKWSIESGATLTNTTLFIQPSTVYAQQDNNGEIGYTLSSSSGYSKIPDISNNPLQVGDSIQLISNSLQQIKYIGVPLILKYQTKRGKLAFNVFSGLEINFLSRAETNVTIETGNSGHNETIYGMQGLKKIYINGTFGVGFQYELTGKLKASLSPTLHYAFSSINQNTPVKKYPYKVGLSAGLTYKF